MGEGEVADAITGGRRRDTGDGADTRNQLRGVDRDVQCEQAAKVVAYEMALALALDRLAHALGHRVHGTAGNVHRGGVWELLENGAPDVRAARIGRDAGNAAVDEDHHDASDSTQRFISALKRSGC